MGGGGPKLPVHTANVFKVVRSQSKLFSRVRAREHVASLGRPSCGRMVFLPGGSNFKPKDALNKRRLAAKICSARHARSCRLQQAAERSAEPLQPARDDEALQAIATLSAQKRKRQLERPRGPPDRLAPTFMRSPKHTRRRSRSTQLVIYRPPEELADGFRLIDLENLQCLLKRLQCSGCRRLGTLAMHAHRERRRGLASELPLWCSVCEAVTIALCISKELGFNYCTIRTNTVTGAQIYAHIFKGYHLSAI